jgi:hypothetical protein
MATLPEIVNWLEGDDSLHLGRLLILVDVFAGRRGDQTIDGITKLAKLDFLLRYPSYLERALLARNAPEAAAHVEDFERNSVEARMVRYKFGPWDHRYRRFLNVLVGKGFVEVRDGRPVVIRLTPKGREAAENLLVQAEYKSVQHRASLLKQHLNLGGRNLMEFIYQTFPEVASLRLGETIDQ